MQYKHTIFTKLCILFLCTITSNIYSMYVKTDEETQLCTLMNNIITIPDIHKEVGLYLFGGEKDIETIKKFMTMPIGKALEWYAITRQMSRGKIMYKTPLFTEVFKQHKLVFPYTGQTMNHIYPSTNDKKIFYDDNKRKICKISDKNNIICLYSEYIYGTQQDEITEADLESFLNIIAAKLFLLSKQETSTLIKILSMNYNSKHYILQRDIKQIQSLTQKIMNDQQLFFKWQRDFPIKTIDFSYLSDPMMISLIAFLPPIFLTGLSSLITHSIAPTNILPSIDEENQLRNIINTLILQSHDERLLKYLYPILSDKETSLLSWSDTSKIIAPFFLLPLLVFLPLTLTNGNPESTILKTYFSIALSLIYGAWSFGLSYITNFIPMDNFNQFLWYFVYLLCLKAVIITGCACYNMYYAAYWQSTHKSLSDIIKYKRIWDGGWLW